MSFRLPDIPTMDSLEYDRSILPISSDREGLSIVRNREFSGEQLVELLERYLLDNAPEFPTLDELASHYCVSTRTLARRLKTCGVTYGEIKDSVREGMSTRLLEESITPISEIGKIVGFRDASNFTKAFKSWRGISPRAYRKLKWYE